jgi:hypothetical protein
MKILNPIKDIKLYTEAINKQIPGLNLKLIQANENESCGIRMIDGFSFAVFFDDQSGEKEIKYLNGEKTNDAYIIALWRANSIEWINAILLLDPEESQPIHVLFGDYRSDFDYCLNDLIKFTISERFINALDNYYELIKSMPDNSEET